MTPIKTTVIIASKLSIIYVYLLFVGYRPVTASYHLFGAVVTAESLDTTAFEGGGYQVTTF